MSVSLSKGGNVSLTNLTGTASPGVSLDGAGSIAMRTSVLGPALELTGISTFGGEGENGATPVPVGRDPVHAGAHRRASRPVRWGCSPSRQPV